MQSLRLVLNQNLKNHKIVFARTINILFSSLSSKTALYEAVQKDVLSIDDNYRLIAVDCDDYCPAKSLVSHFLKMPPIKSLNREKLLVFLQKNKIRYVVPTRDGELPFWADNLKFLEKNRIGVMVSSSKTVEICEDKFEFSKFLQNSPIPPIKTILEPDSAVLKFRSVVVKERRGSASQSIKTNIQPTYAIEYAESLKEPIFQPYIEGKEFSAETWINNEGICKSVVLRWRVKVIDGESHETYIFENQNWVNKLISTFSLLKGLKGHVLAQVIVDKNENLHLIEINPRLGGASPLALSAGLNSVKWSILEFNEKSELIPKTPKIKTGLSLSKRDNKVSIF